MHSDEKKPNEVIRRLSKMLSVTELKVFDENLFAFFYLSKNPEKALSMQAKPKKSLRLPIVCKSHA